MGGCGWNRVLFSALELERRLSSVRVLSAATTPANGSFTSDHLLIPDLDSQERYIIREPARATNASSSVYFERTTASFIFAYLRRHPSPNRIEITETTVRQTLSMAYYDSDDILALSEYIPDPSDRQYTLSTVPNICSSDGISTNRAHIGTST